MSQMPLPKYHQIYLVLREQLDEGRFADGLPGELALMEQFGVARVTVRRALAAALVRRPDLAQAGPRARGRCAAASAAEPRDNEGRPARQPARPAGEPGHAWACAPPSR